MTLEEYVDDLIEGNEVEERTLDEINSVLIILAQKKQEASLLKNKELEKRIDTIISQLLTNVPVPNHKNKVSLELEQELLKPKPKQKKQKKEIVKARYNKQSTISRITQKIKTVRKLERPKYKEPTRPVKRMPLREIKMYYPLVDMLIDGDEIAKIALEDKRKLLYVIEHRKNVELSKKQYQNAKQLDQIYDHVRMTDYPDFGEDKISMCSQLAAENEYNDEYSDYSSHEEENANNEELQHEEEPKKELTPFEKKLELLYAKQQQLISKIDNIDGAYKEELENMNLEYEESKMELKNKINDMLLEQLKENQEYKNTHRRNNFLELNDIKRKQAILAKKRDYEEYEILQKKYDETEKRLRLKDEERLDKVCKGKDEALKLEIEKMQKGFDVYWQTRFNNLELEHQKNTKTLRDLIVKLDGQIEIYEHTVTGKPIKIN